METLFFRVHTRSIHCIRHKLEIKKIPVTFLRLFRKSEDLKKRNLGDPSSAWPRPAFPDRQLLSRCIVLVFPSLNCIVFYSFLTIVRNRVQTSRAWTGSAPCRTFLLPRAIVASSDLLRCGSSGCSLYPSWTPGLLSFYISSHAYRHTCEAKWESESEIALIIPIPVLERQRPEDDVLAGELHLHQGCLRHAPHQDGRVDGECREGITSSY